ncbi:MAG TPA: hypothetical protein VK041_01440 [Opitutales bacterium]|nr:hypothetical protein [Opitutales bacterium]
MKENDTAITIVLIFCFAVALVGLYLGRDDQDGNVRERPSPAPAGSIISVR